MDSLGNLAYNRTANGFRQDLIGLRHQRDKRRMRACGAPRAWGSTTALPSLTAAIKLVNADRISEVLQYAPCVCGRHDTGEDRRRTHLSPGAEAAAAPSASSSNNARRTPNVLHGIHVRACVRACVRVLMRVHSPAFQEPLRFADNNGWNAFFNKTRTFALSRHQKRMRAKDRMKDGKTIDLSSPAPFRSSHRMITAKRYPSYTHTHTPSRLFAALALGAWLLTPQLRLKVGRSLQLQSADRINGGRVRWSVRERKTHWRKIIFTGLGVDKTLGVRPCNLVQAHDGVRNGQCSAKIGRGRWGRPS